MSSDGIWVTFCSRLPKANPENPDLPGYGIARRLEEGLRRLGFMDLKLDNWRDVGYSLDCVIDGRPVYLLVSYVGQGPREWALCCTSDRGLIAKLLRRPDDAGRHRDSRLGLRARDRLPRTAGGDDPG